VHRVNVIAECPVPAKASNAVVAAADMGTARVKTMSEAAKVCAAVGAELINGAVAEFIDHIAGVDEAPRFSMLSDVRLANDTVPTVVVSVMVSSFMTICVSPIHTPTEADTLG